MKLDRWLAALVILLGAMAAGSRAAEDQFRQPSGHLASDQLEVRWLRQGVPIAPSPAGEVAPQPDSSRPSAPAASEDPFGGEAPADGPVMTLAELESIALANNPTLIQADARVRAARAKCLQVGLYPNPTIGYLGEDMGSEGRAGKQGAFAGQEIVTAGKLGRRRAVVAHEVRQAEHARQAQYRRVLNDLRTAAYDVLVAQRSVVLNRELVRIAQQGVKTGEQLLTALEIGRGDVLQFRIEAGSASIQLYEARNGHLAAWRRLAAVLGIPQMEPARLAGELQSDLPQLTWQGSIERLLAESPELARARSGVERARAAVARECAERIPNFKVETAVQYQHSTEDTVVGIQFGVPLPIFNRNQGNIIKAKAELIAAENEVRRVELALQERLAAAFRRYDNARYGAEKYTANLLPNAKESLELVLTAQKLGEFDYLTLLTAQRTYTQVSLAHLQSLREVWAGSVLIEGLMLTGGLQGADDR